MRSAILLAFVALYGCATAPGYRSSSVQPPQAFRETSGDPQPATPSPESPHPLSPSPVGRRGTQDAPPVSADYWAPLRCSTLCGQADGGGGPLLLRAAGSAGTAPSGPTERREPAPHVRPYEAAARRGARQRIRYGAGAGAAQLDARLDSRA